MFSFLGPLIIILSLVGIIAIVLRRTPLRREAAAAAMEKAWAGIRWAAARAWHWVLEIKQASKSTAFIGQNLQQTFRKATSHLPRPSLKFFLREGEAALSKENFAEAERKFIKVIEREPKNEEAYAGLGKLYLAQKKFEDAIQTYKFLVKHFPENDSYYSSLGQAYHGQKLYERAVEAYERAIELAPDNAKRYVNLGLTLEAQRHLEEAILNYRRAVDMEKDNTQVLFALANALVKKGEKEEAENVLEHILVLEPTNHLAREKLMAVKGY